jgi:single-stranded DNA-binding protein
MEYGSACWVDGRVRVEEWDEELEEERMRLREERRRAREAREREASGTNDHEKAKLGLLIDLPGSLVSATPAISPNNTGTSSSAYTTQSSVPPSPTVAKPNTKKRAPKQKSKPKPPIVLHLKTPNNAQLSVAPAPVYAGPGEDASAKMRKELERRWEGRIRSADGQVAQAQMCAVAGFEESLMGGSLQFE